jgi:hypothetical protein
MSVNRAELRSGPAVTRRDKVILVGLVFLLWGLLSFTYHAVFVSPDGNYDFYPRWYGSRAMLEGRNPYDIDMKTENVAGTDYEAYHLKHQELHFLYPATITYILLPFWGFPFPVAVSLWSGLQLLLLLTLPLVAFYLRGWTLKPLIVVLVVVFSALLYSYAVITFVLGHFVIFILGCLVIAWWQIDANHPWLAALALVGATIRPEGMIFVAAILLELLLTRRYKIIVIWAGLMAGVFLISVAQIGFWIGDFLHGIRFYRDTVTDTAFPLDVLGVRSLETLIMLGVVVWGVWLLWQLRVIPARERFPLRLSVFILVILLAVRQSKDYTYVYALLPMWVLLTTSRPYSWNTALVLVLLGMTRAIQTITSTPLQPADDQPVAVLQVTQLVMLFSMLGLVTYHWVHDRLQTYTEQAI